MMKEKFIHHFSQKFKIPPHSRILVAVSGGMDSVALLHLLNDTNFIIGIAHANFQLRGNESDQDASFVKALSDRYSLPFYTKRFDTKSHGDKEGISTQMAARQLRYIWFEELAIEKQWDYIATAHQMDDQIETFFINLLRGTGISGLKGIQAAAGNIIRPLLPFYRNEIELYVKTNRLDYREDSSNIKTDYLRNRIRHHLIPMLDELQPAFRKIMSGNIDHLESAESFFRENIARLIPGIVKYQKNEAHISIPDLLSSGHAELLLHEILFPYGFTTAQTRQIWQTHEAQAGKTFFSPTHRLLKDREKMLLQPLADVENYKDEFAIEIDTSEVFAPLHLQFQSMARNLDFCPVADPDKAFLDFDTLEFPLKIRKWKPGDKLKPLGMKGHMKLSDFFIANKFSIAEKEKTWLLTDSNHRIIWIIGHRIADQNKIKPATKSIYKISWVH